LHATRSNGVAVVIQSFADRMTEDIFHGAETKAARGIPRSLWAVARRELDALDAAADVQDLRAPPGNRLERLRGSLQGLWSTRINDPFRIVFRFEHGTAHEVRITDHH
jgi:proteic killer suppression protein